VCGDSARGEVSLLAGQASVGDLAQEISGAGPGELGDWIGLLLGGSDGAPASESASAPSRRRQR